MTKYIEREEVIRVCSRLRDKNLENYDMAFSLNWALQRIARIPVADVAPVVHGEWIWEEPNSANRFRGCFLCNKCFETMYTKKNFCPNCGADMGSDIII